MRIYSTFCNIITYNFSDKLDQILQVRMKSKDTGHMKSPTKTNVLTPPTKIEIVHSTYNRSNGSCKKLPSKEFFTHKQNRQQNMGPSCEKGDFKRFFTSS